MTLELDRLRTALENHPLGLAVLFGSQASGIVHPGSDVDIAILPLAHNFPLSAELALQEHLERACGRTVDLVRLDHGTPLLRWEVAKNGKCLLEAIPGEFARFRADAAIEHDEFIDQYRQGAEAFRRAVIRDGARGGSP